MNAPISIPGSTDYFLARQPILNRKGSVEGYELLFRSAANLSSAEFTDQNQVVADTILNSVSEFGIHNLVGGNRAYINVSSDVLMSEAIELLPREHVVLEILENVAVSGQIVSRCQELSRMGFILALDDHTYTPEYEGLYRFIRIVKIEILHASMACVFQSKKKLSRWDFTFLAEKVETHEQHRACLELGFDLFQGYYFSRPEVLSQKRIDPDRMTLLRLLSQLNQGAEIEDIEGTFRQNPNLIYNLLRLVNSVAFGLQQRVTSIRHAIVFLGTQYLKRWVTLALYVGKKEGRREEPLLQLAAIRGKIMEQMAVRMRLRDKVPDVGDRAFITGALSVVDALLNTSMENALGNLNLTEDIMNALLRHEGILGLLLDIALSLEKADFDRIGKLLAQTQLTPQQLLQIQVEALTWAKGLSVHTH